jgi:hypothetical protein
VYRNDVVPQVPPRSGLDYVHIGKEYRSSSLTSPWKLSHEVSRRSSLGAALALVAANAIEVRLSPRDALPGPSIDDHMPPGYLEVSRYTLNPKTHVLQEKTVLDRASEAVERLRARLPNGVQSVLGLLP